ncbi:uracil-DNA glycosylase family protein [Hutsoniella sourekii]
MDRIQEIREVIIADPDNQIFTDQGWEPIFQAPSQARVVIIGQAPGIRTQEAGRCFDDASGDRLREWLGISREDFYHSGQIAVLPLDFYFPGKAKTGDLPPRKGFASKWHPLILAELDQVQLIILAGAHAQAQYLADKRYKNLTQTVYHYQDYLPDFFPIPHPFPLNGRWLKKNPWFEDQVLPDLVDCFQAALKV